MKACCEADDGNYKCEEGLSSNSCSVFGRKDLVGGKKCGLGNNGVICKKPENGGGGSGGDFCASGCRLNGVCQDSREKCFEFLSELGEAAVIASVVGGLVCVCVGMFLCYWCCCNKSGNGRKISIAVRQPGETYLEVLPDPGYGGGADKSYMEMK